MFVTSGKGIRFCAKVTSTKLEELKKLDVKVHCCMKVKRLSQFLFHPYLMQVNLIQEKRRATRPLEKAFNVNARETLDLHIARIFFSSGLSFYLAKKSITFLEKEKQHVERINPQKRPLLNFIAVTESGLMFFKAVDCSDEIKDKDYVAKQIR
ncbi:hypothetical protein HN51_007617, partial [Arachis hypogaea]